MQASAGAGIPTRSASLTRKILSSGKNVEHIRTIIERMKVVCYSVRENQVKIVKEKRGGILKKERNVH